MNQCNVYFTVLKHISSFAYFLELLTSIKVHLVFHVNHIKELLGSNDYLVSVKTLATFEDLAFKPHKPERILNSRTK